MILDLTLEDVDEILGALRNTLDDCVSDADQAIIESLIRKIEGT